MKLNPQLLPQNGSRADGVRAAGTVEMKRLIATTVLCLLLPAGIYARQQSFLARVTVYWASGGGGSDACTREHKCATGAILRTGHCAVDPKKIPYGSKVIFPDATCVAVDTGRDVINRKAARRTGRTASERSAVVVDRFFETKREAMAWANAHPHFMTLRVESPNEQSVTSDAPPVARKNSQVALWNIVQASPKHTTPPSRRSSVVLYPIADSPQKKLIAANGNGAAGLQLSRRF